VFARVGKRQHDLAPVRTISRAPNQPLCLQSIYKFNSGVMLDLKAFGKRAHRRLLPSWQPFDGQ